MWIEQRGDHYIAIERYKDYLTGKTRRVSVPIEKDTPQARKRAERALQAKIDAQAEKPSTVTLNDLKTAYIAFQKRTVKASTVKRNEVILNIVIGIIGKDALCDRLTAGSIMSALTATGKENVTINTYLTRLKAMLRWGYQNDMCQDLASKLRALPDRSEREKIADKYLERAELKKLLDGMAVEQWRNLSRLLALSGLRIGEAVALTYDDVDVNARIIHVNKTFAPTTKTVTSPKTTDSVRDVYMQDELLKLCKKLLTGAKLNALERGYSSRLLFCDAYGKHISYDVYEKYLRENSERILGRKVTSHIMRHTMTSLFAEAGVDLAIIARRLGHHDSKLTRDIYLHCTQAQTEKDHAAVRKVKIL